MTVHTLLQDGLHIYPQCEGTELIFSIDDHVHRQQSLLTETKGSPSNGTRKAAKAREQVFKPPEFYGPLTPNG
jgi:hypothetical protein